MNHNFLATNKKQQNKNIIKITLLFTISTGCQIQYFSEEETLSSIEILSEETSQLRSMFIDAVSIQSTHGLFYVDKSFNRNTLNNYQPSSSLYGPPDGSCAASNRQKTVEFSGRDRIHVIPEKLLNMNDIIYIKIHIIGEPGELSYCTPKKYSIYLYSSEGKKYHLCSKESSEPCYLENFDDDPFEIE